MIRRQPSPHVSLPYVLPKARGGEYPDVVPGSSSLRTRYERHHPEDTVLYQVVPDMPQHLMAKAVVFISETGRFPFRVTVVHPEEGNVKRLRYISRFAQPMQEADIEELVRAAQKHNEREDITGILVATGDLFFQIIEGPDAKIDALFGRIAADPRHREVVILSTEQGDFRRMCPDWAMRKVDLSTESRDRAEPIRTLLHLAYSQQKLVAKAVEALESFTWRGFIDAEMEALGSEE